MASVVTNRGKYRILGLFFRALAAPANIYAVLCTSAVAPVADTNTLSELTQITGGTGYTTDGMALARNSTDFDVLTEDDVNDRALVQAKDLVWTGSGGNVGPARWMAFTDDNVTPAVRDVLAGFDLVSDRTVSDTQSLTLQNAEVRLT